MERRKKLSPNFLEKQSTRREMLRNSAGFAGSALLAQFFPASLLSAGVPGLRQQASTPPTDSLAAMRAQMGRYASAETHHQFQSIVLGGDLEYGGMPSFRDALKPDQVQSIQAYVLSQAAAASKPAPSKAP